MGITAEIVAKEWHITREEQDHFAANSHQKALAAQQRGDFNQEICPISVKNKTPILNEQTIIEQDITITQDEGPRRGTSYEAISKLKSVFLKDGRLPQVTVLK